jgi:hypothetical protein
MKDLFSAANDRTQGKIVIKWNHYFFNRIAGFFRIIMINPNPVNPEKSCNPVQKNEPFI